MSTMLSRSKAKHASGTDESLNKSKTQATPKIVIKPKAKKGLKGPGKRVKKEIIAVSVKTERISPDETVVEQNSEEGLCPCCGIDISIAHKNIYKCLKCSAKFKMEKSLSKHIEELHSTAANAIKCPKCPMICMNKKIYKVHALKHKGKQFCCPAKCGQTFSRKFDAQRHARNMGCLGAAPAKVFQCSLCPAKFNRNDNLLEHVRGHLQGKRERFKCKYCDKTFRRGVDLNMHFSREHVGEKDKFQCDICKKWYISKGYLTSHIKLHDGTRSYRCEECGYYFRTKPVLKRHMLVHEATKPYQCDMCNSSFIQRSQMEWHIFWHTGYAPYKCRYCQMAFPVRHKLRKHEMYEHEGKPKYECWFPNCNKTFTAKHRQRMHITSHSEEKGYHCTICNRRFNHSTSYRVHIRVHVMEKTRRCPLCMSNKNFGQRAYSRTDLILRHIREKHFEFYQNVLCQIRQMDTTVKMERMTKANQKELRELMEIIDSMIQEQEAGFGLDTKVKHEPMNIKELVSSIEQLLLKLIDETLLRDMGWPATSIDQVLVRVVESLDMEPADPTQPLEIKLRENTKSMLRASIDDEQVVAMLDTHLVDTTIRRLLVLTNEVEV